MQVELFDFDLPERLIAVYPLEQRDSARLLMAENQSPFRDGYIYMLPELLATGDVVVFNDTKVIPAKFFGVRNRQGQMAKIELNLHRKIADNVWRVFARPAKRLKIGDLIEFSGLLKARVMAKSDGSGEVTVQFIEADGDLAQNLNAIGKTPLPPYITTRRSVNDEDRQLYQTVYALNDGSVAAPTAGLHFTTNLLARLRAKGINCVFVTLHVGAGTFMPVKVGDTKNHRMHKEWGVIDRETADVINKARARGGKIVTIGTTSLRLLETASDPDGHLREFAGDSDIFITPGYRFKTADLLLTNFHLPRSTLFMLVAAFCGLDQAHAIYRHAIANDYRFYSYGDGCLLWRV